MECKTFDENLALYLYEELGAEERSAFEAHVQSCQACRALLEQSRGVQQLLHQRPAVEPTPELLVECREGLYRALDREQFGWRGLMRSWLPAIIGVPASRAVATAALVVLGFGLGWVLRPHANGLSNSTRTDTAQVVPAGDLSNVHIDDITQMAPDSQTGAIRITLNAERKMTLEGSVDDPRIRDLLVNAIKGYDNAGIRRDTLDALRAGSRQPSVREALIFTMQHDPNTGMRLEALKTVQGMEWGSDLSQALIDSAGHEQNPGVRLTAIDALVNHAEQAKDRTLVPELQRLAGNDSNRYVRITCAKAVHDLVGDGY
ncbi:MAG: zf-HC2 domain-containing protein [Terriglobia bacterium]